MLNFFFSAFFFGKKKFFCQLGRGDISVGKVAGGVVALALHNATRVGGERGGPCFYQKGRQAGRERKAKKSFIFLPFCF